MKTLIVGLVVALLVGLLMVPALAIEKDPPVEIGDPVSWPNYVYLPLVVR